MLFNMQQALSQSKASLQQSIENVKKAATGTGATDNPALVAVALSAQITNMIQFLNPITGLLNPRSFKSAGVPGSVTYQFPKLTQYRAPGSYGGEKSTGRYSTTSYARDDINIKARKSRFKVWNIGKRASEEYIDMVSTTLAGEAVAFSVDFAMGVLWDNEIFASVSDKAYGAWESSFDTSIQTNRVSYYASGLPVVPTDTSPFKDAFVRNMDNGGEAHRKVWLMSPYMAAKITDFPLDQVRYVTGIEDGPKDADKPYQVHIGLWPKTLMGIPVYVTSFLGGGVSNSAVDTMGSVTLGQAATGGSLSDGTYYIKVTKVIRNLSSSTKNFVGETCGSAGGSIAVNGGGSAQRITATFTADPNAYYYRVYYSATGAAGSYKLVGVYPGSTYDSDGNWTADITSVSIGNVTPTTAGIPAQGVYGAMQNDLVPTAAGGFNPETVLLWDLDSIQGFGDFMYLDESPDEEYGMATLKQIAELGDYWEWMLYSYGTPLNRNERTSVMIKGLRAGGT